MRKFSSLVTTLCLFFFIGCAGLGNKTETTDTTDVTGLGNLNLNLPVESFTLPNGLRVLLMANPTLPIYSYYTFFDIGGRYESGGTTGATHFLEHMMFKGSQNYGPGAFDKFIESNGGQNNAYTSFDSTVYFQNMPKDTLEEMIKMEADRMSSILLIPEAFESERRVILEERKMRYENSPRGQLFQAMTQAIFEGTPYGGSVIGSEEDVLNLDRDRMLEFHRTFYAPNNAIVVIVGDINTRNTRRWIERHYGTLAQNNELYAFKQEYNREETYQFRARLKREIRLHGQSPRPMFALVYKGEKLGTRRAFVMDMLSSILGSGQSSYLYQNYVSHQRAQLSSVSVMNYNLKYNGVFAITGELLTSTALPRFRQNLAQEMTQICDKALDERSLQKTKNQYLIGYYGGLQTNAGVAHFLGARESFFDNYKYYEKELEIYNSIELDELKTTCREIVAQGEHIFISVWDKHPAQ